jgi:hypothetical protein
MQGIDFHRLSEEQSKVMMWKRSTVFQTERVRVLYIAFLEAYERQQRHQASASNQRANVVRVDGSKVVMVNPAFENGEAYPEVAEMELSVPAFPLDVDKACSFLIFFGNFVV